MSNQSGIVVHNAPNNKIEFRTGRWSADEALDRVWKCIQDARRTNKYGDSWLGNEIATNLMNSSGIEGIGITNTDQPTISVWPTTGLIECHDHRNVCVATLHFTSPESEVQRVSKEFFRW